jgi:hypothetical protein
VELSTIREATSCAAFCGTRMPITAFARAPHLYQSRAIPIQPTPPQSIYTRFILMLSTHLRLGLPSGLSPFGFRTNNLYAVLFLLHSCYKPRPPHPPRLDNSNYTWRRLQMMQLPVKQLSPTFGHFIPLGANNLLSPPFSNTLSLCSSLNIRDQVSHPYRTTNKLCGL